MKNEINSRLDAFLTWKSTGEKPEGWNLEPQNQQEYYLSEEAKRIDRIENGEVQATTKNLRKNNTVETNDYNEFDNIPIKPIPEIGKIIEGEYYYDIENQNISKAVNGELKPIMLSNTHLYKHNIILDNYSHESGGSRIRIYMSILNNSNVEFTANSIYNYLTSLNYTWDARNTGFYPLTGEDPNGAFFIGICTANGYFNIIGLDSTNIRYENGAVNVNNCDVVDNIQILM